MKYFVFFFLSFFCFLPICYSFDIQEEKPLEYSHSDHWMIVEKGTYHPKSSDSTFIASTGTLIEGNVLGDTSFLNYDNIRYLANEQPIALFTKMDNVSATDVAGVLKESSLVTVDTIYYNRRYIDSEDAPMTLQHWSDLTGTDDNYFFKYPMTFNVWYAININGKKFYTDYKLHDLIEYKLYMPTKKQMLLLCSQSTGYDGGYDLGYPDYYVIVVLEEGKDGWKQVYRSQRLDLNNSGENEYGISDIGSIDVVNKDKNVVINFSDFFQITWTGKSAIVDILKEYE